MVCGRRLKRPDMPKNIEGTWKFLKDSRGFLVLLSKHSLFPFLEGKVRPIYTLSAFCLEHCNYVGYECKSQWNSRKTRKVTVKGPRSVFRFAQYVLSMKLHDKARN